MSEATTARAEQIIARCRELAEFTEVPGQITRTFLCPPMHAAHSQVKSWMEDAGMTVSVDAVGNIRGVWDGLSQDAPRLIIGSHLDSVVDAGPFDGVLGVMLGIAVVEQLGGERLPFAIEVIGFSEEEGVRFHKPFIGSLAVTGRLDDAILSSKDKNGVTVVQAIQEFGLDINDLSAAVLASDAFAYLEFHIEQGPVLDSEGRSLAVVHTVVGQTRCFLTFTGQANHAGTTPMQLRHDAMAAAAEWIVTVEALAREGKNLVATVGRVETSPGAGNIIAARVTATLDVRHASDSTRKAAVELLLASARRSAESRGVGLVSTTLLDQRAVPMDRGLIRMLQMAAERAGFPAETMPSGAGHDAMIVASRVPSAMLFLRSPGGLSHHPKETATPQDVEAALATAMEFLAPLHESTSNKGTHA